MEFRTEKKNNPGFTASMLDGAGGSDLRTWRCTIPGANGTLCAGASFKCTLKFTDNYPSEPPVVHMEEGFLHPNVCPKSGIVCLSTLQTPSSRFPRMNTAAWWMTDGQTSVNRVYTVSRVMIYMNETRMVRIGALGRAAEAGRDGGHRKDTPTPTTDPPPLRIDVRDKGSRLTAGETSKIQMNENLGRRSQTAGSQ